MPARPRARRPHRRTGHPGWLAWVSAAAIVIAAAPLQQVAAAEPPRAARPAGMQTGAERLVADDWMMLRGQRVALITNHTGLVGNRHLADLMHAAPEVELVALFGPEHGIRGDAPAGARVDDGTDPATGVPVYSLYGANHRLDPARLRGVDVLVFDIQDVGARFYTYISTMGYGMQAAASAGVPMVILDRPNPLGGLLVEGPVLERGRESFVGRYPIPVVHGMTVGELAGMIQAEGWLPGLDALELHVVAMTGWRRDLAWNRLGRVWVPPSPNLPDWHTALVYPGTCFLEGTSISEGRGTRQPFLQIGAPWIDAAALAAGLNARQLPGVRFEPVEFQPRDLPGMAMNPRFRGDTVRGVRLEVTDPARLQPVRTGIHLLEAVWAGAPEERRQGFFRSDFLTQLAGTTSLERRLRAGTPAEQIIAGWQPDLRRFIERRQPHLIYPPPGDR